ncbi:MAG: alpha/beta fold hydrolase [Pseudomonadota bacterium]
MANTAPTFAQAEALVHDGVAGRTPVWRWASESGLSKVLLLHGWGGQSGLMGAFVSPLLARGHEVVIPDLPGQGSAKGPPVDTRLSALTILELNQRFGPFQCIIGHSLGGLLALMVAAGHDVLGGKASVSKVVTINSPVSLSAVIEGLGGAIGLTPKVIEQLRARAEHDLGFCLGDTHAQRLLERANLPALSFHDADDPFIPHAGSLAHLTHHAQKTEHTTHGLGHISVLEDEAVIRQVVNFIGQPKPS